jgi:N-ethylmaleimide reductase
MSADSPLLKSFQLGDLTLKNRIALAPMTRARAGASRMANATMAEYYAQRSNAGLVISEATVIGSYANGWNDTPGIYSDAMADAWKQVVEAVHRAGSVMYLQLWHCGRASHSSFLGGSLPMAPSAIPIQGDAIHTPTGKQAYEVPQAMDSAQIERVIADYGVAARRAKAAGFDGVEIHGANGYLIDEFLQSKTNHRTDGYGGTLENRYRFLKEVVQSVLKEYPANRVGVRLSPNGVYNDMGSSDFREQFTYVATS